MPGTARRQPPGAVARVGGVPAHRLVLDVHHLVMGVEQLDPMAVWIAEVDEQRMAGTVPARAVLEVLAETERARDVAGLKEAMRLRDRERHMMEARARAIGDHDVLRIALALNENEKELEDAVGRNEHGQAAAQDEIGLPGHQ